MGLSAVSAVRTQFADYVELSKPRIALVVLVTTFAGMWMAAGHNLPLSLILFTLVDTGLASASAGVLNNYIDRDIDPLMSRTSQRAIAAGRVEPQQALLVGLTLAGVSFLLLVTTTNLLAATLAMGTIYFYVVIYTMWLKRNSDLCTEVGGIAGALPPIIGWAAVTGSVGLPALLLFLIMFIWQPPISGCWPCCARRSIAKQVYPCCRLRGARDLPRPRCCSIPLPWFPAPCPFTSSVTRGRCILRCPQRPG